MNTPLQSATRDHIAAAVAEIMTAAVAEIAENRAVIDQAKGMLILLYGVDDQTAFDTLRRHSQNTNIKHRTRYRPTGGGGSDNRRQLLFSDVNGRFPASGGERDGLTIHDTMGALDRHLADLVDREALRPLILATRRPS